MSVLDLIGLQRIFHDGKEMFRRKNLNFIGGTVTDNPKTDSTDISIGEGGGGGGGAVSSVFTRVGAVVAEAGDYTSNLVSNVSSVTGATVSAALEALSSAIASKADKNIPVINIAAPTYTITLAGNGAMVNLTNTGGPAITIPNDATLATPDGYTQLFCYDVTGEVAATFTFGSGVAFVEGPFVLGASNTMGIMKKGANRWVAVGEFYRV